MRRANGESVADVTIRSIGSADYAKSSLCLASSDDPNAIMVEPSQPAPGTSDPDFTAEENAVKREELDARRQEARAKLIAAKAPWWRRADPLVLAVSAGVFTLAGNMYIAWYNAQNSINEENSRAQHALDLEKEKAKASLIIQALSTSDATAARRNLLFFVNAGLIADGDGKIRDAAEKYGPVLPSAAGTTSNPPTTADAYTAAFWSATLRPDWIGAIDGTVNKLIAEKAKLESLAQAVHSPWYVVGVSWILETGGNLSTHWNGDPLSKGQTTHPPAGRPPIWPPPQGQDPWQYSAQDELTLLKLNNLDSADLGDVLSALERSNGLGYQKRGLFSPYLWGGTTLYERGKFAGGVWDPNAVSAQVGAVAMLRRLQDKNVIDLHAANVATTAPQ